MDDSPFPTGRRLRRKHVVVIVFACIAAATSVWVLDSLTFGSLISGRIRRVSLRNKMVSVLSKGSPEAVEAYCLGTEGLFYRFEGGDWIAIPYCCSHCYGTDIAVYRDSRGRWLESHDHFCGGLSVRGGSFDGEREDFRKFRDRFPGDPAGIDRYLAYTGDSVPSILVVSEDVNEAYRRVVKAGRFRRIRSP